MKKVVPILISVIMFIVLIVLWAHKKDNPINVFFGLICVCFTVMFVVLVINQIQLYSLKKKIKELENNR